MKFDNITHIQNTGSLNIIKVKVFKNCKTKLQNLFIPKCKQCVKEGGQLLTKTYYYIQPATKNTLF